MLDVLESVLGYVLPVIIHILEFMGVMIVCFGAVRSIIAYFKIQFKPAGGRRLSDSRGTGNVKIMLGTSLELGLEYKMGAEIIKTILIRDLSEIWILGAVIVLRAMLFVLIHFEMNAELKKAESRQKSDNRERSDDRERSNDKDNEDIRDL